MAEIESAEVGQARAELHRRREARFARRGANLSRETGARRASGSPRRASGSRRGPVGDRAGGACAPRDERLRAIGLTPRRTSRRSRRQATMGGAFRSARPINGTVIERKVTLGAGGRARDRRVQDRRLDARLGAASTSTRRIWRACTSGSEVEIRTDALPGEMFGRASRTSFRSSTRRRARRRCGVEFDNPSGKLHTGQLVTARIIGDPKLRDERGPGGSAQRARAASTARPSCS